MTELVQRSALGGREQPAGRLERAGAQAGLGGRKGASGAERGVARQRDGALQERRRGRATATVLCPARTEHQLARDGLVGTGGGGSQVPDTTIGIELRVGRLGQRRVDRPPVLRRGCPVDGRARQRMAEDDAVLHGEQPVGRIDRRERDSEPLARAPHEQRIADRLGCRDEQQATGFGGEQLEPPDEARLDPPREVVRLRQPEPAGQLRRRQPAGQLEERQGVPAGLREDAVANGRVQRVLHGRVQECSRIAVDQAADLELRQPAELLARLTRREDEADRLGEQPASDESERQGRRPVEPLGVVDDAEQRPLLRHLGHEPEHGEPDQEAVRRRPGGHAEHGPERVALWGRQPLHPVEHRRAQLVQARERELHLRLHPDGPGDRQAGGCPGQVIEQRGLADPRLAAHDQRPADPYADVREQLLEEGTFVGTAQEAQTRSGHRGGRLAESTGCKNTNLSFQIAPARAGGLRGRRRSRIVSGARAPPSPPSRRACPPLPAGRRSRGAPRRSRCGRRPARPSRSWRSRRS